MTAATAATAMRRRLPAAAGPLAVAGAALLACVAVNVADPNEAGHYPTCPFLALTGHPCPGCGTLRAVRALTRLDLATAVSLNALTVALLPALVWGWLGWWRHARGHRTSLPQLPTAAAWTVAVAVPLFWLLRNVPVAPLSWLAP